MLSTASLCAADPGNLQAPSGDFLRINSLGRLVETPTNSIPAGLLPLASVGMGSQIPFPQRGMPTGAVVQRRVESQNQGELGWDWFPSRQPPIMPYLAGNDRYGNTAQRPGPLIESTPLDVAVQQVKYELSSFGLNYSLAQTFTVVNLGGDPLGSSLLGAYTFDFAAKWTIWMLDDGVAAGWISTQIEAQEGLGSISRRESPQINGGTFTNPSGVWSQHPGFRIPELAWQQSLAHGKVMMLAGVVSQGNYLDANSYANSSRGQFLNSGLINSMVLPLPDYNPGVNLQWQPTKEWYVIAGLTAGNAPAGSAPWTGFSWRTWSAVGEFGYVPQDVAGLGPGVYRIQPFIARADGPTQGGLAFNFQQRLGNHTPVAWFGRFGFGGPAVTDASAQIGTGFIVQAPLKHLGLIDSQPNDGFGIGVVWSQPSPEAVLSSPRQETVLETAYVMNLTPLIRVQPDLQFVWNPSYHPTTDRSVVLQLQVDLSW